MFSHKEWRQRNPEKLAAIKKRANAKMAATRRSNLAEIKLDRGCIDCGYNAAPEALHFDHRNPSEKLFTIGNVTYTSWAKILLEIEKCDVRCANCHAVRSKALKHHSATVG